MKIKIKKDSNPHIPASLYSFVIVDSLLKTHFKELARMAKRFEYNDSGYTGWITKDKEQDFLNLCARANKVSKARAEKSHANCAQAKKNRAYQGDQVDEDMLEDIQDIIPSVRNKSKAEIISAAKEFGYLK